MKIAPICLLTACKRRKFKLFGNSSQVRAIDNGITCCYWSATGCVHWKRTVPYSNVVQKTAQIICTGYKENIVVLESGYFFDYLCHWNWFLLSLLISIIFLYIFLIRGGGCHWQGTASGPKSHIVRSTKWHWQGRKVTQGPKCHIGVLYYITIYLAHQVEKNTTQNRFSYWYMFSCIPSGNVCSHMCCSISRIKGFIITTTMKV